MGQINVFNFLSLNGFYKGLNEDISWALHDDEQDERATQGMAQGGTLLFGRVTYEMMASFWPTPEAHKKFPAVAAGINKAEKIVFSRTLQHASWNNSRVINEDLISAVRDLKEQGRMMTILGSGSLVTQLSEAGLIDGFEFLINPVALGQGTPIFSGAHKKLNFQLLEAKARKTGLVLLRYKLLP